MNWSSVARTAPWLIVIGAVAQLSGLAVDGLLHERNGDLADEALVSLNPGHVLIGAGMALTAAGAAVWLAGRLIARGAPKATVVLPPLAFAVLGAVALLFAFRADDHDDGHGSSNSEHHEAAVVSSVPDGAGHGHEASIAVSEQDLRVLSRQLDEARAVAEHYRDIRRAVADGYVQVTQDLPGIAAHFLRVDLLQDGVFDPSRPEMLLYTFRGGAWRFAGLSYAIPYAGEDSKPEGFASPLDTWHFHENLCALGGAIIGVASSPERCLALGGDFVAQTFWMNHVWVGGPSPAPSLFAEAHPLLLIGASWKLYQPGDPVAG